MYTNAQNQQILRVLNKALELGSFVTNQYLISQLVFQEQFYKLPIKVLLAFPEFITMQVTEEDIADSAKSLHSLVTIDNYIYIPYQIFPFMLVIKEFCSFGNPYEITSYIKALHGREPVSIHKMVNDIVITFQNIDECVVFWRGTKYYPFKGEKFIESQIYSQLHASLPLIPLQDVINAPRNNRQTDHIEQQIQRQGHQRPNDQYNDTFQQSSQTYQQKKSSRPQNYRYYSKSEQYNGDNGSHRFSQSQRLNKNKDRYSQNQPHKQPPHILLQASPKQQPNPPAQYKSQPQIQPRSHSQPLVLQPNQQKLQMQSKFQQQPQTPQSPQSPQSHNRNYRQNQQQQQQQNHYQQEQQQNQEQPQQPQQQNHHQQEQQQPQEQPQPSSARSPKPKKYYRTKKQTQKK